MPGSINCISKIFILGLLLIGGLKAFSQDDSLPDYLRKPRLPPFSLLRTDSSLLTREGLDKDKKVLIMIFSPGCGHCRQQTDTLIAYIDKLRDVEIVMATFEPLGEIISFNREFHLEKYSNIKIGRDIRYFLTPFYGASGIPFLALYNQKAELLTAYQGFTPVAKILAAFKEE